MKTYEITLKHDNGTVTIRTKARNLDAALETVCKAENAPRSSMQTWRIVPTAKQIKRTQRLMSNI